PGEDSGELNRCQVSRRWLLMFVAHGYLQPDPRCTPPTQAPPIPREANADSVLPQQPGAEMMEIIDGSPRSTTPVPSTKVTPPLVQSQGSPRFPLEFPPFKVRVPLDRGQGPPRAPPPLTPGRHAGPSQKQLRSPRGPK